MRHPSGRPQPPWLTGCGPASTRYQPRWSRPFLVVVAATTAATLPPPLGRIHFWLRPRGRVSLAASHVTRGGDKGDGCCNHHGCNHCDESRPLWMHLPCRDRDYYVHVVATKVVALGHSIRCRLRRGFVAVRNCNRGAHQIGNQRTMALIPMLQFTKHAII